MKVTTKGQVTIPQHVRRFMDISPYTEVDFQIHGDSVILVKTADGDNKNEPVSRFAAMRGTKNKTLTTDEWLLSIRGE